MTIKLTVLGHLNKEGDGFIRVADLDPNTRLLTRFDSDPRTPATFHNRVHFKFFNYVKAPSSQYGIWTVVLDQNFSDPAKDQTLDITPMTFSSATRVFKVQQNQVPGCLFEPGNQSFVDKIVSEDGCSLALVYPTNRKEHLWEGVYIDRKCLERTEHAYRMRSDILSLPVFSYDSRGFFTKGPYNDEIEFLPYVGSPDEELIRRELPLVPIEEAARIYIKEKLLSWREFQSHPTVEGSTKQAWKACKALVEIVKCDQLKTHLMKLYRCSEEEFIRASESVIGQIHEIISPSEIPVHILIESLRLDNQLVTTLRSQIESEWRSENEAAISDAQAKLEEAEAEVERLNEEKQQLECNVRDKRKVLELEADKLKAISNQQENVLKAIDEKFASVRQDASDLIADIPLLQAVLGPRIDAGTSSLIQAQPQPLVTPALTDPESDLFEDVGDLWDMLIDNLETAGMTKSAPAFASIVIGAYRTRTPLILAGPGSNDIADAVSMTFFGTRARVLDLESDFCTDVPEDALLLCKNCLEMNRLEKRLTSRAFHLPLVMFEIPFAEELTLLSPGIYNFALPICTELYLQRVPEGEYETGFVDPEIFATQKNVECDEVKQCREFVKLSPYGKEKLLRVLKAGCIPLQANETFNLLALPSSLINGSLEQLHDHLNNQPSMPTGSIRDQILGIVNIIRRAG